MQSILTSLINIVVLSFLVVMALDFIVGLCVKTRRQAAQSEQLAEQSIEELPKQPPVEQEQLKLQLTTLPDLWTPAVEELPQNVGRQLLKIESPPVSALQSKLPPERATRKVVKKNIQEQTAKPITSPVTPLQADKLTFDLVCADFASSGFTFERSTGRYRYKVIMDSSSSRGFKKLQDALEWLDLSR